MAVLHMNADDFKNYVTEGKGAVIVDFFATWCGPCKILAPFIEQIAAEFDGQITVGELDIDENMEIAQAMQINAVPTVMFFKDGKAVQTFVGVQPKEVLTAAAKELL